METFRIELILLDEEKVNLTDIRDIAEIKSVVVVATIKVIERDNKWYYLACVSCNRIVDEKTMDKKDSDSGSVSLTLFNRVAFKLLNRTAVEFIREMRKNGDMDHFPEHFNILLGCNYAFKVDITKYCLDNHKFVYPVATCTDDGSIIDELEAMESTQESLSSFLSPPTMGKSKGALSGPEESISFSYQESNDTPPLKRSVEVIHVEDISNLSSNKKGRPTLNDILNGDQVMPKCRGRPSLNDISNDDQGFPKCKGRPPLNDISEDVQFLLKRRGMPPMNDMSNDV
nr:hypothetical protein [Tanacetum cinerariifolium]